MRLGEAPLGKRRPPVPAPISVRAAADFDSCARARVKQALRSLRAQAPGQVVAVSSVAPPLRALPGHEVIYDPVVDTARDGMPMCNLASVHTPYDKFRVGRGSEVNPKVALGFAESNRNVLTEDFHFPQLALKSLKLAR